MRLYRFPNDFAPSRGLKILWPLRAVRVRPPLRLLDASRTGLIVSAAKRIVRVSQGDAPVLLR